MRTWSLEGKAVAAMGVCVLLGGVDELLWNWIGLIVL